MAFQKVVVNSPNLPQANLLLPQIRFLGGKLGEAIANEYDVSAVGDLL
jgi:hypothetical protein